jgi:anti-sigma factor RsiW
MSCTVESDLTAYLDGELSPDEASRMKAHLATCEDCRATEVLLHRTVSSLRALPPFEPSRGLRRRVLAQVETLPASSWAGWRQWLRPVRLLPSGAALAAAVAAAWVVNHRIQERHQLDLAVAANYELLSDYEVVGLSADDLDVVEHLDELEGRP